ncbi:PREDICTED: uncharacterized protein LOC104787097 [Camelina sativa]|uniref:Uncharacterized protein LOC104787097 n=1 Tax=Camelina sativa TaxID=90675 RepID=A0ABM0Z610_CAMSA|nr:PREDICTED: uncharacterized protein LOC104787097 [Camelina sativa]
MAIRNTIQMYLTTVVAIAILLAANQATEARFTSLCTKTAYPTLCRPLVKGPNPRRATHSTIRALEAKTKLAIAASARYKNGNPTVAICYATLVDASFNLVNARKSIRKRNVMTLKMFLTAAVSDYGVCVDVFINSRQVNRVQNAVDELRKIGTNCLLLATLIR